MFLLNFVFRLCFSLLLNFCCFTAQCKIFQITTPELVQVKIYLKYSSGVFQVLLHLKFTWTSSYLNLVQVNLPELFLHTLCTYFPCFWNFNVSARLVMSNSAHFLHFLFRSNSSHFMHFFSAQIPLIPCIFCSAQIPLISCIFLSIPLIPVKFRSFRSSLAFFERNLSGLLDLGDLLQLLSDSF